MSVLVLNNRVKFSKKNDEVQWLPVSDLMAGLMVIFLFVAISYMRMVVVERDSIKNIVVAWETTRKRVYQELYNEFRYDLDKWNAQIIESDLSVRFNEPEVLFEQGKTDLQQRFKEILDDFFPRYIKCINLFIEEETQGSTIEEIRIEGHTSSEWNNNVDSAEAYFNNMWLSQGRTRSVLQYCYSLKGCQNYGWLKRKIAAVGYSSSHLVFDEITLQEDKEKSRRVIFRVKTTVEKQLMKVIE
ncbi:MAG: OmpA family protein [Desulfobacteraceae bacterium]|nr:OmpA family protein [Desulfobacteraceae bacterium]